jgi:D-tyrosyl-tRNA(Tyr) deacylase
MIGLLQRVTNARVEVDGHTVGEIGRGLLVLVAVHRDDGERDVARLAERILSYRVFPDDDGRMNRSVVDEGGGLLLVPQFRAAAPEKGEAFFRQLVRICRDTLSTVETGEFGANMQVALVNDGPVTFWIES